jgi:hypothetical protein
LDIFTMEESETESNEEEIEEEVGDVQKEDQ